jgi:hypothetical protein
MGNLSKRRKQCRSAGQSNERNANGQFEKKEASDELKRKKFVTHDGCVRDSTLLVTEISNVGSDGVIATIRREDGGFVGHVGYVEVGYDADADEENLEAKEFRKLFKAYEPEGKFYGKWDSKRTQERREAFKRMLTKAAKGTKDIVDSLADMGRRNGEVVVDIDSDSDDEFGIEHLQAGNNCMTLQEAQTLLSNKGCLSKTEKDMSMFSVFQHASVLRYIQYRLTGESKMKASLFAVQDAWPAVGGNFDRVKQSAYKCACVRRWTEYFLCHREFAKSKQGKHPKTHCVIYDEAAKVRIIDFLRATPALQRTPAYLAAEMNTRLLRTIPRAPDLGFTPYDATKKSHYVDGHERPDVVQHRTTFLAEMLDVERRMTKYEDGVVAEEPVLQAGEKRVVLVTHDESIFYSNDATRVVWCEDENRELRPKSWGQSLMVSAFICDCHSFLCREINGRMVKSYEIIEPGSGENKDGWWTNSKLMDQIDRVAPLFKECHPDADIIFCFDNSSNHRAHKPDALVVSRMNKGDNGKNSSLMRSTEFMRNDIVVPQTMVTATGGAKGMWTVLLERELVTVWEKLNATCENCRAGIETNNARCCCTKLLSSQPDFKAQRIWIEEALDAYGIKAMFYPKFHCELNPIELVWSHLKCTLRRECSFSFKDLKVKLPNAIEAFSSAMTRRMYKHCFKYMQGYREGLTGRLLDYALKKYRGHRMLPAFRFEEWEIAYKENKKAKEEKRKRK